MRKILFTVFWLAAIAGTGFAQFVSLADTTITFKDQAGKVLNREEVQVLMKGVFSIRQELVNGKKVITIIPSDDSERVKQQLAIETFRASLIDKPAPSFQLKDKSGTVWNAGDLKGKVVVINFWFTSCKPCIQEIPHLNELVKQNKENPVVFIAPAPEAVAQVNKFLKKYPFDYNIIPSSLDFITTTKVESFPTHLVIDKRGIVKQVLVGYAEDIREKLQAEIDKLVKE